MCADYGGTASEGEVDECGVDYGWDFIFERQESQCNHEVSLMVDVGASLFALYRVGIYSFIKIRQND